MNNRFSKPTADATKNTSAAVVSIGSNFISGLMVGMLPVSIVGFFASMTMPAILTVVGTAVAGTAAAMVVGAALVLGLPMLLAGGIFGVMAYRRYKKTQAKIEESQISYSKIYNYVTNTKKQEYEQSAQDAFGLIADAINKSQNKKLKPAEKDSLFEKLCYVSTLINMLNDANKKNAIVTIKDKVNKCIASFIQHLQTENNELIKTFNDNYDTEKLNHKFVFENTSVILSNYDKISKLNFLSDNKQDSNKMMCYLPDYQKALRNNHRAAAAWNALPTNIPKVIKHEPWGESRSEYFNPIVVDYQSKGIGAALKTFGTKTFNRALSFFGGVGLALGISAVVLGVFAIPFTWPVLLACGVVAAAVGAVSAYTTYKLDRDQHAQAAEIGRRNEMAGSMAATHIELAKEKEQKAMDDAKNKLVNDKGHLEQENAQLKQEIEALKNQLEEKKTSPIKKAKSQLDVSVDGGQAAEVTVPPEQTTGHSFLIESHAGLFDNRKQSTKNLSPSTQKETTSIENKNTN